MNSKCLHSPVISLGVWIRCLNKSNPCLDHVTMWAILRPPDHWNRPRIRSARTPSCALVVRAPPSWSGLRRPREAARQPLCSVDHMSRKRMKHGQIGKKESSKDYVSDEKRFV